ncbi:uncharacterized protein LOC127247224 [Andrographis paniculata]|uniref:uncharacterized protein LOC127247224 n=1 Tax=Andrographis paniculata TaxID=175694 RepID=UPI0021E880F9|nr:uncharacterized protein LOC127247224 [Andrographis paniculata]
MEAPESLPQILTPSGSGRRRSGDSNSPEFEFWMVRNPSFPPPNLLSADELFSDGVLLPLQDLRLSDDIPTPTAGDGDGSGFDRLISEPESSSAAESAQLSASSAFTSSKRWRDIFKKKLSAEVNGDEHSSKAKEVSVFAKGKRREKKNSSGGSGVSAAELNINIWPFRRSRSAGNGGARPRSSAATRKVSSAPCSRSNSAGESKSRKWPNSPRRGGGGGVPVGRSSPVWQVRRSDGGNNRKPETADSATNNHHRRKIPAALGASKVKAFTLNVPTCIGYRHHLSCRSDEHTTTGNGAPAATHGGADATRSSNLLNIRSLFTKKVY